MDTVGVEVTNKLVSYFDRILLTYSEQVKRDTVMCKGRQQIGLIFPESTITIGSLKAYR